LGDSDVAALTGPTIDDTHKTEQTSAPINLRTKKLS